MNEEEKIVLIERYLLDQMNEQERKDFLALLQSDDELKLLFKELSLQISAISKAGREELSKKIKGWEHQISTLERLNAGKSRSITLPYLLGLAATVVLVIVSVIVIRSTMTGVSNEDLFFAYYEPYPDVTGEIERSFSSTASPLQLGLSAYNNNDFKLAIVHFENLLNDEKAPIAEFYMANSYLALGDAEKAIPILTKIKAENTIPALHEQVDWYLGMSYLKLEDRESALSIFGRLAKAESVNGRKARKVVKKLIR